MSHFWWNIEEDTNYSLKERLIEAVTDLIRVVASPLSFVALELVAIYGLINPRDGMKLYASIERLAHKCVFAPQFQPQHLSHPVYSIFDKSSKDPIEGEYTHPDSRKKISEYLEAPQSEARADMEQRGRAFIEKMKRRERESALSGL